MSPPSNRRRAVPGAEAFAAAESRARVIERSPSQYAAVEHLSSQRLRGEILRASGRLPEVSKGSPSLGTVLVCDDEEINRALLERLLRKQWL